MGRLIGGIVFILVGALVTFFFEAYRDFSLRKLRAWGRSDTILSSRVPFQPFFIWAIRGFGVLFMVIGLAECIGSLS